MSCYVVTNETTKNLKRAIIKFSKDVSVNTNLLRGKFTVQRYRRYIMRDEVDIIFQGEIYVTLGGKKDWYSPSILDASGKNWRVSKIKVNRFIKKSIFKNVLQHLNYFDIRHLHSHYDIKKITWI